MIVLATERLELTPWNEDDRGAFTAMVSDPAVMHDYPAPWSDAEIAKRFERHAAAFARDGHGKWAIRRKGDSTYLGYCGVSPIFPTLPCAPGLEIGWRLVRAAWGHGYATEAARAALVDIFERFDAHEVVSYTLPDNVRSLAVMARLALLRVPERDFLYENGRAAVMHVAARDRWPPR